MREVVVITGASAGVGRATAIAFARRGARIGLLARGRAGLVAAQRDVEAAGGEALICEADVADSAAVDAAAAAVERVPPIFQPEVAAEAILFAATHERREMYVGLPTVVTIAGNGIAPGVGDWYLARVGAQSQQTEEPEDPKRPHNLWQPVDATRDFGAHGRFDARARSSSWQLRAVKHRGAIAFISAVVAGIWLARLRSRGATASRKLRLSAHSCRRDRLKALKADC